MLRIHAEGAVLWACAVALVLLAALGAWYAGWQQELARDAALAVIALPFAFGMIASAMAVRRHAGHWWILAAFALGAPALVAFLTRTERGLGEDSCGAGGLFPFGWDNGFFAEAAVRIGPWMALSLLVGAGVLLTQRRGRPFSGRLALAGLALAMASGWVGLRCVGT